MADLDTDNPAPWYTSRSLWGAAVSAASGVMLVTGHAIDPALLGPITDIVLGVATVVGSVVAAEGRITATKRLR